MNLNTLAGSVLLTAILAPQQAHAQSFPSKPVRVIVPAASGSAVDLVARLMGPRLTEAWGQPVVVENVAGAGGVVGTQQIASAPRDGYTLGVVASNITVSPSLFNVSFNVMTDFTPISLVAGAPLVLFTNPGVPAANLKELIALAKAKPRALNYASAGNGSAAHLAGELMKSMAGVDMLHVPYKALPQGILEVMAGAVSMFFATSSQGMQHVGVGKLRALAVTSAVRAPSIGNVPTMAEAGIPGYETTTWFGLLGPGNLPGDVANRIYTEVAKAAQSAEFKDKMAGAGLDIVNSTQAQFRATLESELQKWANLVKTAGIKAD
jgi:tripartite-type tricarboxylate transporter receptor subunit TctC